MDTSYLSMNMEYKRMIYIAVLAGLGKLVLGWGNILFVTIGMTSILTNGISANFSVNEIVNNRGPNPLIVLLAPISGLASILSVLYLFFF
jgi:hypothetical protein